MSVLDSDYLILSALVSEGMGQVIHRIQDKIDAARQCNAQYTLTFQEYEDVDRVDGGDGGNDQQDLGEEIFLCWWLFQRHSAVVLVLCFLIEGRCGHR